MSLKQLLYKRKYEFLLAALILHLFIGIFIRNLFLYSAVIWPMNMLLLGLAGYGVFAGKGKWKNIVRNVLVVPVIGLPLGAHSFRHNSVFFALLSAVYIIFFVFIYWELIRFLIRPGYINADIISAAACGYFLLVEIATFLFQLLFYENPVSFKGIDANFHATIFNDLVDFSSITITSIGFGDITPTIYYTRLLTALLGSIGQFYSVVLVGIVISKFASKGEV